MPRREYQVGALALTNILLILGLLAWGLAWKQEERMQRACAAACPQAYPGSKGVLIAMDDCACFDAADPLGE